MRLYFISAKLYDGCGHGLAFHRGRGRPFYIKYHKETASND